MLLTILSGILRKGVSLYRNMQDNPPGLHGKVAEFNDSHTLQFLIARGQIAWSRRKLQTDKFDIL